MMLSCCNPVLNGEPSLQLSKLMKILHVLMILQMILGVFNMFFYVGSGLLLMVGALILYCIQRSKNYFVCLFYIILTLMLTYISVSEAVLLIEYSLKSTKMMMMIASELLIVPFSLVSIYYVFLTYRETKALMIEQGNYYRMNEPPPPSQPPQRQYFTGQGHRLD